MATSSDIPDFSSGDFWWMACIVVIVVYLVLSDLFRWDTEERWRPLRKTRDIFR